MVVVDAGDLESVERYFVVLGQFEPELAVLQDHLHLPFFVDKNCSLIPRNFSPTTTFSPDWRPWISST